MLKFDLKEMGSRTYKKPVSPGFRKIRPRQFDPDNLSQTIRSRENSSLHNSSPIEKCLQKLTKFKNRNRNSIFAKDYIK
uniref:Uncharacterized protein n=1 Tax=Romanomermis culicivorax TaxID=13658 RepID=A0A915IZ03_ROMCU